MTCFGCGYVGEDAQAHTRQHWARQIARVQAFGQAHPGLTERIGVDGQRHPVLWSQLTNEATAIYRRLLKPVACEEAAVSHFSTCLKADQF